jgi:hypothetical protein
MHENTVLMGITKTVFFLLFFFFCLDLAATKAQRKEKEDENRREENMVGNSDALVQVRLSSFFLFFFSRHDCGTWRLGSTTPLFGAATSEMRGQVMA